MYSCKLSRTYEPQLQRKRPPSAVLCRGVLMDDGVTPPGSGMISKGCWQVAVPGQEIINPVGGMIGDMRQHVTQPGFGVDTVQLGGAEQRVDRGGALAAAVGAGEQIIAAADGHATQGAFGRGVIDLDGAVVAIAQQRRPPLERVRVAAAVSDLRDKVSSVLRSQRSRSSSSGRERVYRTCLRSSGGLPRISLSTT